MTVKSSNRFLLLRYKPLLLFLFSQGISYLGDTFQLIAATTFILHLTGSGLSAGFGIICTPLPSLFLSPLAGKIGDRIPEKFLLAALSFLKGILILLFIGRKQLWEVYILLLSLAVVNVFFNPSSKKMMVSILQKKDIVVGNSLLSGISGAAYLLGPVIAGSLASIHGVKFVFIISSLFFITASFILFVIPHTFPRQKSLIYGKKVSSPHFAEKTIGELSHYGNIFIMKKIIITGTIIFFGTTAINIAFYPFAFDVLKVDSRGWGLMLSIFYGTNLLAMFISFLLHEKLQHFSESFIYLPLLFVSIGWLAYGMFHDVFTVILFQIMEGTAAAICNIFLITGLQLASKKAYAARVMGINDMFNNGGKILGALAAYSILYFYSPQKLFFFSGMVLLIYVLFKWITAHIFIEKDMDAGSINKLS